MNKKKEKIIFLVVLMLIVLAFATRFEDLIAVHVLSNWESDQKLHVLDAKKKSALGGDILAQLEVGDAYRDGDGVKKDYAESMKWFLTAADQSNRGDADPCYIAAAMFEIGKMYEKGQGVRQDIVEVYKWFDLGTDRGMACRNEDVNDRLLENLKKLSVKMSPSEIAEAHRLITEWRDAHPRHAPKPASAKN
jgi:hypothetical protein